MSLTPPHYEFGALEIGGSMLTELYTNRAAQVEKELETFLAAELAGTEARRVVLEGDPARQIVEYAHEENVGLIVMPTHGYGPFRQFILGPSRPKCCTTRIVPCGPECIWRRPSQRPAPFRISFAPSIWARKVARLSSGPRSCRRSLGHGSRFCMPCPFHHPAARKPNTPGKMKLSVRDDLARMQQTHGTKAELA